MKNIYLLLLTCILISCMASQKVNYKYMGSYKYEIFNDSLHNNNSYLSPDSYGYVIGNLDFKDCGIRILNIEKLNPKEDYIVTINHPIRSVSANSSRIVGEGQEYLKKKPLDITLNKYITNDSVYIYILKPKDKYRLLLP